jgi:selenocysteine lyase/cysteine desulfurase
VPPESVPAGRVVHRLADREIGVWANDSWYSLGLYKRVGYEDQAIRIGVIYYNTAEEVDGQVAALGAVRD